MNSSKGQTKDNRLSAVKRALLDQLSRGVVRPARTRALYRAVRPIVKNYAVFRRSVQELAKEGKLATLRLPSGEIRLVPLRCRATLGQVGNPEQQNVRLGKAGRGRWIGRRPHVRGVAMNPVDHPHGGGEGKAPIGRKRPVSRTGKPALGARTRRKKSSDNLIVRRRSK